MSKEEECESADKNPLCPYITRISNLEIKVSETRTDVGWLKKGYWVQISILLTLMGFVIALFAKGG